MLAKKPEKITLGYITRLFEGQAELVDCISSHEKCLIDDECLVRPAWQRATQALYRELDAITITDLLEKKKKEAIL